MVVDHAEPVNGTCRERRVCGFRVCVVYLLFVFSGVVFFSEGESDEERGGE